MPLLTEEQTTTRSDVVVVSSLSFDLRMTMDGFEYIGNGNNTLDSDSDYDSENDLASEPYDPIPDENHNFNNRALKIIGADTRRRISNTTAFPFRVIGALGYRPDNTICTGTVIYKSAVLTAAHCVYDIDAEDWAPVTYFAPARYVRGSSYYNPYGYWLTDYMTVPNTYTKTGSGSFDYAVITLKKVNLLYSPKFIGDHIGYAGLAEVAGYDDAKLDASTITGYPADLNGGRQMWTMGKCNSGFIDAVLYWRDTFGTPPDWMKPNVITFYDCDITGGTSGSSFLGSDEKARGVNGFEMTSRQVPWNGGVVFKKGNKIYNAIMIWSGRKKTRTISSPTPAPQSTGPNCFSSNNLVETKDSGIIKMSKLKIGDHIRAGDGIFTQVYGFGHVDHDAETNFMQLHLEELLHENDRHDIPLEITSNHLVFVERNSKVVAVPSSDIVVGDRMSPDGKRVKEIHRVTRRGIYAPLTFSGDLVVSGVLASNHVQLLHHPYVKPNQHILGQVVWYPRHVFCQFFMKVCMEETYNTKTGYSAWADWIVWASSIINQCQWVGALSVNVTSNPLLLLVVTLQSMTLFGCFSLTSVVALKVYKRKSSTIVY
jgi:V8-like Glu-specific endopeptidase